MRARSLILLASISAAGAVAAGAGAAAGATLEGVVASGSPGVVSQTNPTLGDSPPPQSGAARAISGSTVTLFHARQGRAVRLGRAITDADGRFSLDYRRPPGRQVLYAVAAGGTVSGAPGGAPPGNALRLMGVVAAGGPALRSISLTELTTVSSAFALSQFMSGSRVSGPSPGLPNAAGTAGNLIDQRTGKLAIVLANSPNGNATEALPTFNTIGNVLARCTRGTRADCARVFSAATPPGRARPRDTLAAALNMARRPTHATRRLFGLRRTVFRPALSTPPGAWVLSLVYTAGGFDAPGRVAFDSKGRIWANNNFEPPGTAPGRGVVALSPTGRPILGSPIRGGGLNGSGFGIAIGPRDRVWVANFGGDSLSLFTPSGRPLSGPRGFTAGDLSDPQGLAIDARGNVWVPNQRARHVTLYPGGDPARARRIAGGGIVNSFAVAIDGRRNAWVTNGSVSPDPAGESSVTKINADGTVDTSVSPIRGGGLLSPMGIAVDSAGNKWVGNLASSSVTVIAPDGTIRDVSPIRAGSIRGGWGVAVDGADNVWVASFLDPRVTQLCGRRGACPPGVAFGEPISPPAAGFVNRGLQHVTGVQVDQSGNVWAVNNWSTSSPFQRFVGGNGLVQFIGLATPVDTPLIGLPRRP